MLAAAGCAADSVTGRAPGTSAAADPADPADPAVQRLAGAAARTAPGDPAAARTALASVGAAFLRATSGAAANAVISPYSLYTVLAMARAGAIGTTADQLDSLLALPGAAAQGAAVTAVDAGIEAALQAGPSGKDQLHIQAANQTWVQHDLDVHPEYLDELARQFGVSAVAADFVAQPQRMRQAINAWVSDRTSGLIPELFPTDSISTDTRLVLVNALWLKAAWAQPFSPATKGQFRTPGGVVDVPMMNASSQVVGARGARWSAATVPYAGSGLRMTLLVPDPGTFDALLGALDGDLVAAASEDSMRYQLTMPTFAITSAPDVLQAAKALGVTDIFDPGGAADLSGIAGEPGWLHADAFVHQARISVDENGTQAAAATGMGMSASGAPAPAPALVIDRPFVFWIADTKTGAPLFLGTVTDPLG